MSIRADTKLQVCKKLIKENCENLTENKSIISEMFHEKPFLVEDWIKDFVNLAW